MAKVIELYDFRKTELVDRLFEIKIKKSKIEKKISAAAERFLTIEEVKDEIIKNDIVAIRMESAKPWLDSECERLRVGRGFSYVEIEKNLLGKKVGDTFEVEIDNIKVIVTVLSAKRRIIPCFTDDMVKTMEIEGVTTISDYRNYVTDELIQEDKEKKLDALNTLVNRQIIKNSTFEMENDEVETPYEEMLSAFEEESETEEEMEKMLLQVYHVRGIEAGKKKMREQIENQIKILAVADAVAKEDGVSWTKEDYDAFIEATASERMPEEELREDFSFEDFITQQNADYLQEKERNFFDDRFTVELIDA